jgi:hypothetical protein
MADITRIGVLSSPYVNHTYHLKLELTILEQNIATNQSKIRLRQFAYSTSTDYQAYSGSTTGNSYWIKINGSNVVYGTKAMDFRNLAIVELGLYEGWVTHADNGQLAITVSSGFDINGPSSLYDGHVDDYSWTLTTIPRYANITSYYLHSTTCIQFGFTVAADRDIDAIEYSLNGGAWTGQPVGNIITGLSPGTNYNLRVRVKATASQLWTESGYLYVTTFALSTASAPNFNLESNVGITISRGSTDLYHDVTLEAYYSGAWQAVALNATLNNQGTSATISPTMAAVTALFNAHPTVKTVSVRAKIVTRYGVGGAIQGETYAAGTANIVNANPTLSGVTYADVNATVQALLANDQKILRNKSTLRVTAGAAASQKGATLAMYKVAIGGSEYSAAANGTAAETGKQVTVGTVNQANNQTAVITVTDSRGNTVSLSFTVQMLDYSSPQILSAVAQRLNNYEQPSDLIINARRVVVNPGAGDVNNIAMRYRIKPNPSGTYGDYITITTTNGSIDGIWQALAVDQYMADYPNDQSYTVEISIADSFTGYVAVEITLTEGIALMKFLKDKIEVGVPMDIVGPVNLDSKMNIKNNAVFHSAIASMFGNGVLVDICDTGLYRMVQVEVRGNGYGDVPVNTIFQAYHYDNIGNFINVRQHNFGANLPQAKFLIQDNRVKLWFTSSGYAQTFAITAYTHLDGPCGITVSNVSEPSVTYKVACTVYKTWNDNNQGPSSGLHADILDWHHASDFLGVNGQNIPDLNLGRTTSLGGVVLANVTDWNNLPMMKGVMVYSNSAGIPTAAIYYVLKIGMRDMSNGYGALAMNFVTGELYSGLASSDTVYPGWRLIG